MMFRGCRPIPPPPRQGEGPAVTRISGELLEAHTQGLLDAREDDTVPAPKYGRMLS